MCTALSASHGGLVYKSFGCQQIQFVERSETYCLLEEFFEQQLLTQRPAAK